MTLCLLHRILTLSGDLGIVPRTTQFIPTSMDKAKGLSESARLGSLRRVLTKSIGIQTVSAPKVNTVRYSCNNLIALCKYRITFVVSMTISISYCMHVDTHIFMYRCTLLTVSTSMYISYAIYTYVYVDTLQYPCLCRYLTVSIDIFGITDASTHLNAYRMLLAGLGYVINVGIRKCVVLLVSCMTFLSHELTSSKRTVNFTASLLFTTIIASFFAKGSKRPLNNLNIAQL